MEKQRTKRRNWLLAIATVLTMLSMRHFDGHLKNEAAPNGIVSFEFAKTVGCAETILNSWDEKAKTAAGLSLGLDYLFLVLYSACLALLTRRASRSFGEKHWMKKLGRGLVYLAILAGAFDAIENFALIKLLLGELKQVWATVAYVFASMKFGIIVLVLLYLLVEVVQK